jgi:hypothetical protein
MAHRRAAVRDRHILHEFMTGQGPYFSKPVRLWRDVLVALAVALALLCIAHSLF